MFYIEKGIKKDRLDPRSKGLLEDIRLLGFHNIKKVYINDIFWVEGEISISDMKFLSEEVLTDHVIEEYRIDEELERDGLSVIITLKPGVFDAEAFTFIEVASDLGYKIERVKTGKRYIFTGSIKEEEIKKVKNELLMNELIQIEVESMDFPLPAPYKFKKSIIEIRNADDKKLLEISKDGLLALNLVEMKKIQEYFIKEGREPTDLELETIAQTWSEHCFHKTFKSPLNIESGDKKDKKTLFGFIKGATEKIDSDNVLLAFSDNAGAIEFDKDYAVTYKVETHNHPSALEPYGGAETGVGGVLRDTMGCGLGAKPFASTDIFCFGDPDTKADELPDEVLHPRRIVRGVVEGVRDYGNRMGIPTVGGSVYFNRDFNYNPLIYVGSAGIIRRKHLKKKVKEGDLIIAVGGKTGRDGIHGATFSSLSLNGQSQEVSGGAVQIGNPIEEKRMLDVLLTARDRGLYRAITDCGAGGFSSAIGEMAEKTGAVVNLEKAPLKYKGLSYWEIWVSESQERMVIAVPPENLEEIDEIFDEENVEYTVLGKFGGGRLIVKYCGEVVGELDPDFLFKGVPFLEKSVIIREKDRKVKDFSKPSDIEKILFDLTGSKNIGSREWIIRQYDHEVQGGSVVSAFSGKGSPSDGIVIRPLLDSDRAVVLGFGIKPEYGKLDPYRMAASVIDEALRNMVAAGGNIHNAALLDNFCFGDVTDREIMGDLYETARACYDYATLFKTPFISGKDSLNNFYTMGNEKISVPPTLLISSISVIEDYRFSMTSNFKGSGNIIFIVGETENEIGGSEYKKYLNIDGGVVPSVNAEVAYKTFVKVNEGIEKGYFLSIHDISSGGLGICLSEMCFSNSLGCKIYLPNIVSDLRDDILLFSESNSRFLIEVKKDMVDNVEKLFDGIPLYRLGITGGDSLLINSKDGIIVNIPVDKLHNRWKETIKW